GGQGGEVGGRELGAVFTGRVDHPAAFHAVAVIPDDIGKAVVVVIARRNRVPAQVPVLDEVELVELLDLDRVGAGVEVGVGAGIDVVGAALRHLEHEVGVEPDAVIVIVRDLVAGGVVQPNVGVVQRAAAARFAALIDRIGVTGDELNLEPVVVALELHATGGGAADGNLAGRGGVAELIVDDDHVVERQLLDLMQRVVLGGAGHMQAGRRLREAIVGEVVDELGRVGAGASVEVVGAAAALERGVTVAAKEGVVATAAFERVVAVAAAQVIVGIVAVDRVVARAAIGVLDRGVLRDADIVGVAANTGEAFRVQVDDLILGIAGEIQRVVAAAIIDRERDVLGGRRDVVGCHGVAVESVGGVADSRVQICAVQALGGGDVVQHRRLVVDRVVTAGVGLAEVAHDAVLTAILDVLRIVRVS